MNDFVDFSVVYSDLMKLVAEDDAFFFKDFVLDDVKYRIFNYRLASWTSFQKPSALWARGIMYDVTDETFPRIVCVPPKKFFNWGEGEVDHSRADVVLQMVKLDGSLISTYIHKGELRLKTKGSLFSEQCVAAMKWLNKPGNEAFKDYLFRTTFYGYMTVNLEWLSPENRIVVSYAEESLRILNFIDVEGSIGFIPPVGENYCVSSTVPVVENQQAFIENIENETEGEGYVLLMRPKNGSPDYLVKVKNKRYCTLHLAKDSVTSSKRLFECVIDEATDDLRGMFESDPVVLKLISDMEQKVQPIFNHLVASVEGFYEANKHLDRKSYALKAQTECSSFMGLVMSLYIGRSVDYKSHAKKFRQELFGIGDTKTTVDE